MNHRIQSYYKDNYDIKENICPNNIICEECEQRTAALYCKICDQFFCAKCEGLCHQPDFDQQPHHHVAEKHVRLIQFGDESRSEIKVAAIELSESYVDAEEYRTLLKIDISTPDSLANGRCATPLKFLRGVSSSATDVDFLKEDYVVFIDPISNLQSYGQIIR